MVSFILETVSLISWENLPVVLDTVMDRVISVEYAAREDGDSGGGRRGSPVRHRGKHKG